MREHIWCIRRQDSNTSLGDLLFPADVVNYQDGRFCVNIVLYEVQLRLDHDEARDSPRADDLQHGRT